MKKLMIMATSVFCLASLSVFAAVTPPGLTGKAYPPGLEKQGKIPHGWTEGEKKGWNKIHHRHYYKKNIKVKKVKTHIHPVHP